MFHPANITGGPRLWGCLPASAARELGCRTPSREHTLLPSAQLPLEPAAGPDGGMPPPTTPRIVRTVSASPTAGLGRQSRPAAPRRRPSHPTKEITHCGLSPPRRPLQKSQVQQQQRAAKDSLPSRRRSLGDATSPSSAHGGARSLSGSRSPRSARSTSKSPSRSKTFTEPLPIRETLTQVPLQRKRQIQLARKERLMRTELAGIRKAEIEAQRMIDEAKREQRLRRQQEEKERLLAIARKEEEERLQRVQQTIEDLNAQVVRDLGGWSKAGPGLLTSASLSSSPNRLSSARSRPSCRLPSAASRP